MKQHVISLMTLISIVAGIVAVGEIEGDGVVDDAADASRRRCPAGRTAIVVEPSAHHAKLRPQPGGRHRDEHMPAERQGLFRDRRYRRRHLPEFLFCS